MKLLAKLLRMRHYRRVTVYLLACLMLFNTVLPVARAGPEGAQVVNGQVSIQQNGNNTAITASDKAIVNYSSFDIARPETVQFIQPSSSASVLNRILSANPTNINGTLLANGRVFFVNPAGVYIGSGARINVNQLVASALNISDADFINGRYNFVGGNGAVINSGDISAEKVYLIGKQVVNSGNISCPAGYVVMAAGDRVFIGEPGSDIVLEVDASSLSESADKASSGAGVLNKGTVEAAGGIIALAAAGDIYSQAISNVGSLSTSVESGDAGQIKLAAAGGTVTNTGTIEATSTSGTGGTVQILGDKVGLLDATEIDVSGSDGGGTVLVGGDYQGKGDIPTASQTYVSPDSSIKADATENGDGGRVIVWADDVTGFYGNISARGGAEGGDGGFAEVSGKGKLIFEGHADLRAEAGKMGTLLLDPTDITISNSLDSTTMLWHGAPDWQFYDDTTATLPSNLNVLTLETQLASSNVEVTTTPGVGGGTGWIQVLNPVGWNSGSALTLNADDYIQIDAGITNTGAGGLFLIAGSDVDINANISLNGGDFTSSGIDFDNTGGAIATAGGNVDIINTGDVTIGAPIDVGAGDVSIDGVAASIIDGGGTITSSGTITFEASGSIGVISAAIDTAGSGAIHATSTAGEIYIDNTGDVTDLQLNADSGTITFANTGSIDTGAAITANAISLTSSGTMTIDQAVTADSGPVTLSGALVDIDQNVGATGNIDIDATGNLDLDADIASSGGNVDIDVAGTVVVAGGDRITAGGDGTELTINGNGITLNAGADGSETVTNTGTGTITITDLGNTTLGNYSVSVDSGALTINSAKINAQNSGSADEIKADGGVSLTAAEIGGGTVIDIGGAVDGDLPEDAGTLTINSNGDGDVDIRIDDNQFDAVDITIAGYTDDVFDIVWGGGYEIDMDTDSTLAALTVTNVNTSNFDTDVVITQNVGNVLVESVDTGDGDFTLTSITGAITDNTGSEATNITATNAFLTASTGIGGAGVADIDTAVDTLTAHVTGIGDIYIEEADGTELTDVDTFSGSIDIVSTTGDLTIGDIDAAGTVTLEATTGSINDAADDTAEDISATTITMTAADEIGGDAALEVTSSALDVSVTTAGDIVLTESDGTELTDVDTLSGSIDIVSTTGDLTIGDIDATGTVTLEATSGSINDAADDTVDDISATTITMTAADEIGGGIATKIIDTRGALEVASSALDVSVTNAGNIVLTESDGTELTDVDTLSGSIDIVSTTGDLTIGDIDATGTVTLEATLGSINDADDDTDVDIEGTTVALTAQDEIGGTRALETTVANLEAHSTTAGDIVITESDGITLTDVDTVAGNIMITAGGSINGVSVIATDGSVDLSAGGLLTATDVQANESAVVGDYDVTLATSAGGMNLPSVSADHDITAVADTGNIALASLTAGNIISLEATDGSITQSIGTITANGGFLTMKSEADLSMINYNVANPGGTNLTLDSTGGSAIVTNSAADDWNLITAAAQHNVVLSGDGDITTGNLESRDTSGLYGVQISTDTGSGGSLDAQGNVTSGGFVTVDVDGQASFTQPVSAGGNIELEAGSNIATGTLTSANGDIGVESTGGQITFGGGITAGNGGIAARAMTVTTGQLQSTNGDILIDSTFGWVNVGGPINAENGNVNVGATGNITTQAVTTTGSGGITLHSLDNITTGQLQSTNGDILIDSTFGWANVGGPINANNGSVNVGATGNITTQAVTTTGSGGIALHSLDNITTGQLQSTNGDISISSIGASGEIAIGGDITTENGGGVTMTAPGNITTQAITTEAVVVTTNSNIEIESTGGNLEINGDLTANGGGVSLIAKSGSIYTSGSKIEIKPGLLIDALNVPITGTSDFSSGIGVDLPYGPGKAAIMIISEDDLGLGTDATLTAAGTYSSGVDDRESVNFASSGFGAGDAIDVAIYLGSYQPGSPPGGNVAVGSTVLIADNGTMVVDAGDTVTFGEKFYESVFNQTNRLEVVSRRSTTLNEVITYDRLPHADDPEAIRSWFAPPGSFTGAYVLRGVKTLLAEVLALANPVPLVPPRPLEPEISGEVEGPDTEALVRLLNELGIGVQPYVIEAYADSLSTDLRLFKAAEKLQELIPVLEDANGTRIAGLRTAVAQFFPTLDVISEERLDSFAQELARHEGDGTDYDLAGQCIFALTEYINILGSEIGWPIERSVGFVMGRYVPRLTEGDEIRIAVIQMHLQKKLGV